jgi:hypothetical protein
VPYRLIETEAWMRAVTNLNPNARVSLPYALDRILADPHDAYRRQKRYDGATIDYGAQGLLIAYQVIEPDQIRLLDVADIKKEHRW